MTTRSSRIGGTSPETRRIQALLKKASLPSGVRGFELRFGEDATGDPAVWVSFLLEPDYSTAPPSIHALTEFGRRIRKAIRDDGSDRIPYVDFKETPTKVA